MKRLHQVHLVLLITLFLGGIYWVSVCESLGQFGERDFFPSSWSTAGGEGLSTWGTIDAYQRMAAVWAGLTCLWTILVGCRSASLPPLSKGLVVVGTAGALWMTALFIFPEHLGMHHVFLIWLVYITGGVVASAYLLMQDDVVVVKERFQGDVTLLDDQWEQFQDQL